jgi:hypothetical protein
MQHEHGALHRPLEIVAEERGWAQIALPVHEDVIDRVVHVDEIAARRHT